jgi:ribosomal protein S18 acetylase RimI-like enzyme
MTDAGPWVVRPATVDDLDAVGQLHVRAWRHAYREIMPEEVLAGLDPRESAGRFAERLRSPTNAMFVAVQSSEPGLGAFCVVGPARDPDRDAVPGVATGELYALYADPRVHGQGAGPAVHGAGVAHLGSVGYRHLVLWVFSANPRARAFYAKHGWRCDELVSYYGQSLGPRLPAVRYSRPSVLRGPDQAGAGQADQAGAGR